MRKGRSGGYFGVSKFWQSCEEQSRVGRVGVLDVEEADTPLEKTEKKYL